MSTHSHARIVVVAAPPPPSPPPNPSISPTAPPSPLPGTSRSTPSPPCQLLFHSLWCPVAPASHFPLFFFVPSSAARSVARSPFPGDSRLWLCVMSCTDDPFELYFALFGALWLLFRLFPLFFSILLYAPLCSLARPRGFTIVGMRNELYG